MSEFTKVAMQPIGPRVLIEKAEVMTKTASGIVLPMENGVKNGLHIGLVVAVGKNLDGSPLEFEVGDTVFFNPYAGTPHSLERKEYVIMMATDIPAKAVEGK